MHLYHRLTPICPFFSTSNRSCILNPKQPPPSQLLPCLPIHTHHHTIRALFPPQPISNQQPLFPKMLKHKVDNIKRMCAHPSMAVYLTGGQDGSVQLWEWGHAQVVSTPRPPGTFAKVTRCRFSPHGNKFGIADGDGNLSLWQAGMTSQCNRPFFVSGFGISGYEVGVLIGLTYF